MTGVGLFTIPSGQPMAVLRAHQVLPHLLVLAGVSAIVIRLAGGLIFVEFSHWSALCGPVLGLSQARGHRLCCCW